MAFGAGARVVGSAFIVVRAITAGVDKDIKKGFSGTDKIGDDAGDQVGRGFRRGFSRSTNRNIFGRLVSQSIAAKEQFSSLTRVGYVLAPALTALGGIIGLLGTSIISLASTIGASLVPAMLVLGQAATALGQAMLTVRLAFSGVAKAIQAGSKAAKGGTAATKGLEKAQKALERAQRALGEAYEDAAERKKDADEQLLESEKALAKARKQAIEDLQQLGFESEDAAIAEQEAALQLEKAREELARVSDLPPNSRARKEAELAFAQADLNYRRAIDRNNDLKAEEAKNAELAKKGQDALIDGQENVVEALKAEEEAKNNVLDVEKQNARAILAATEARDDAQAAVDELKEGGGAADAYADALEGLSKEARAFVEYMVKEFIPALKELKAAAGEKLFPKLIEALENIKDKLFPALIPLLRETGGVLGEIAKKFSETVTKGENIARLERIWKSNDKVLRNFGDALNELYEVILILLEAVSPLTEEFSAFIAQKLKAYKETLLLQEASGELANKFQIVKDTLKDLGAIFGNVFRGLSNLFFANVGPGSGGEIFLNYLKDVTKAFENLETIDGKPVKQFFADAAENGVILLGLLGDIFGGFIKLADNEGLGIFLTQLREVVRIFFEIGESMDGAMVAFGAFLIEFAKFIQIITESGSIEIFFNTLRTAFEFLNNFLRSELGQRILELSAQILPLLAAFGLIAKVGAFFGKVVLGSIAALFSPFAKLNTAVGFLATIFNVSKLAIVGWGAVIIGAIALLVTIWNKSEIFRKAVMDLVTAVGTALKEAFDKIMKAIKEVQPEINKVGDFLKTLGDVIGTFLIPIIKFVFVNAIKIAADIIVVLIKAIAGILGAVSDVGNKIGGFLLGIKDKFVSFVNGVKTIVNGIKDVFRSAFDGAVNIAKGALNILIRAWNNTLGKLKVTIPKIGPFGGGTVGFPTIPELAEGGTVFPQAGGVLARVAEAGRPERIEPLDPDGLSDRDKAIIDRISSENSGKNVTVNVYPSAGMDERELASIVSRQIAFQLRKGAA